MAPGSPEHGFNIAEEYYNGGLGIIPKAAQFSTASTIYKNPEHYICLMA